jgi:hypothetical protein
MVVVYVTVSVADRRERLMAKFAEAALSLVHLNLLFPSDAVPTYEMGAFLSFFS